MTSSEDEQNNENPFSMEENWPSPPTHEELVPSIEEPVNQDNFSVLEKINNKTKIPKEKLGEVELDQPKAETNEIKPEMVDSEKQEKAQVHQAKPITTGDEYENEGNIATTEDRQMEEPINIIEETKTQVIGDELSECETKEEKQELELTSIEPIKNLLEDQEIQSEHKEKIEGDDALSNEANSATFQQELNQPAREESTWITSQDDLATSEHENDDDITNDDKMNDDVNIDIELDDELGHENDDYMKNEDRDSLGSDFCGESASNRRLRELRLDALEDIQVCGQNRHSTQAARRLFADMDLRGISTNDNGQQQPQLDQTSNLNSSLSIGRRHSSSLSTSSSMFSPSHQYANANCNQECNLYANNKNKQITSDSTRSNTSSPSRGGHNSRTLVLSLNNANNDNYSTNGLEIQSSSGHSSASSSEIGSSHRNQVRVVDDLYPMEQDEVASCRLAFRENKRLIEARAGCNNNYEHHDNNNSLAPKLPTSKQIINCSHCQKRLYPLDCMELDFTRTRLNIHKTCFKCQICFTMLRLETYAAIDAKLYCPVHVKNGIQNACCFTNNKHTAIITNNNYDQAGDSAETASEQ